MYTALIFKEQEQINDRGLREKGLAQPHYSIQHIEGYELLCNKDNNQYMQSSIIHTDDKEYSPGSMINITSSGTYKNRKDYQEC
jgi:hypothetical protein